MPSVSLSTAAAYSSWKQPEIFIEDKHTPSAESVAVFEKITFVFFADLVRSCWYTCP